MAITLGSNIASLRAQRSLSRTSGELGEVFARLASGQRINKASDDAAGLAISDSLNADARIFAQALRNVNDGLSVTNIAHGALAELNNILTRQKELAEQAANGTYSMAQRAGLHKEANALVDEFNRIVATTKFNGRGLLDGSNPAFQLQLGRGPHAIIDIALGEGLARNINDGTFAAPATYTMGGAANIDFAKFADLNNDGILDIVDNFATASFDVLLGNGDGTFKARTNYALPGGNSRGFELGDLNGDGNIDFVGVASNIDLMTIRLGNGNGTFRDATTYDITTSEPYCVTIGDFDNDGKNDVMVGSLDIKSGGETIDILYGKGDGTVEPFQTVFVDPLGSGWSDLVVGDFNGDDIDDVAAAGFAGVLRVFLGGNDRSLSVNGTGIYGGIDGLLRVADFNLDGLDDLAGAEFTSTGGFGVRLSNGDGTFTSQFITADNIMSLSSVGDFNGDGYADLAGHDPGGDLAIAFGRGDGTFQALITSNLGFASAGSTNMADVNDDGTLDFLIRSGNNAVVSLGNGEHATIMPHFSLMSRENALESMGIIDDMFQRVADETGRLGSEQSRLEIAANVLTVARENYLGARGRILDADVAEESAALVRKSILQQAAASVLAQANQQPALALQLLR